MKNKKEIIRKQITDQIETRIMNSIYSQVFKPMNNKNEIQLNGNPKEMVFNKLKSQIINEVIFKFRELIKHQMYEQ